ncbi:MAG TPA: DUF6163 family protein [Microvirga sp.]|nr:DUF6163 family protein [Microvirga sp.]
MARNGSQGHASDAYASDRIEERQASPAVMRWSATLIWFMRILALLWIMKGLSAWAVILGVWTPIGNFEARSTGYQAIIIYFALIDLVAAVGLWMASSWGGIVWLLAIMSHLILAAFFPDIVVSGMPVTIFFLTLITAYMAVSWLAARSA